MAKMDELFQVLISSSASDLHLEQGQPPKMRALGHIKPIDPYGVLTAESMREMMQEICPKDYWKKYEATGDTDFCYELADGTRFRANYYRHLSGYGAVFRVVPSKIIPLDQMGLPEAVKTFAQMRSGLILVTGPTGSGKSTSLASILDFINRTESRKIVTIEEPVEFMHKNQKSNVIHREVGADTASFASGLRSAMKSDADVILVGEMRDQETIMLALTAAQMGLLVFGTLHTNSAIKTIDRIIDVFPIQQKNQARMVLSNTLKGVLSQQLIKSADGKRRLAACELMLSSPGISAMIADGDTSKIVSEIQASRSRGSILMDDCLIQMVAQGKIKKEDAFMKALDKISFSIKAASIGSGGM